MIKNFEEIKSQLKGLAEVINGFKSEAVQLRIVELVFGFESAEEADKLSPLIGKQKRRKPTKTKPNENTDVIPPKKSGSKSSGQGAVATLIKLVDENFFDKPKSIGDITRHCDHNLARKFPSREFSGKLGRLVREGTLKRSKNAENQYEYQNS